MLNVHSSERRVYPFSRYLLATLLVGWHSLEGYGTGFECAFCFQYRHSPQKVAGLELVAQTSLANHDETTFYYITKTNSKFAPENKQFKLFRPPKRKNIVFQHLTKKQFSTSKKMWVSAFQKILAGSKATAVVQLPGYDAPHHFFSFSPRHKSGKNTKWWCLCCPISPMGRTV